MESVYLRKTNVAVTENINFQEYFKQYSLQVFAGQLNPITSRQTIKALLEVDEVQYSPLVKKCNPHALCVMRKINRKCSQTTIRGFRKGFKHYELPDDLSNISELKSLQYLKNRNEPEKLALRKSLKYVGEIPLDPGSDVIDHLTEPKLILYEDYILTVRIYMPWKHRSVERGKLKFPQVSQEFLIPGNMTLDKLRDRIACPEDYQDTNPDVSESPFQHTELRSGDIYKSAMFYIGNIFYVDTRHEDNIDYSEVVRKWASWKKLKMEVSERMEDTTVSSIICRMGYPYVYVHQGCCEHILVITDARLLHPDDVQILEDYPVMISFSALKGKVCDICKLKGAKFIICDSPILTYDYSFLCSTCTFMYNYVGTTKAAKFTMYKYIDRLAVL